MTPQSTSSFGTATRVLARTTVQSGAAEIEVTLSLNGQANGQAYEELLWSPEHPRLIDARIDVTDGDGRVDSVSSYLGLRSAAVDRRLFLLNDRPQYVRSVLSQGYWPESHLAAPSADALRDEVQLIKDLGFNATRIHQKFEDPRFLFWADRLGPDGLVGGAGDVHFHAGRCRANGAGMARSGAPRPLASVHRDVGTPQRELGRSAHRARLRGCFISPGRSCT